MLTAANCIVVDCDYIVDVAACSFEYELTQMI